MSGPYQGLPAGSRVPLQRIGGGRVRLGRPAPRDLGLRSPAKGEPFR